MTDKADAAAALRALIQADQADDIYKAIGVARNHTTPSSTNLTSGAANPHIEAGPRTGSRWAELFRQAWAYRERGDGSV